MGDAYTTAFKLLTLGYSVMPSGGGDKGKAPLVNWRDYQATAPNESQLEDWEQELKPQLWGIVTNGGIAVVDADTPETRAQLEAELGEPHVSTPRGGAHWYINTTGHPFKTVAGLLPGVDIRGVGGFVNIAGRKYRILRLPVPGDTLIPWQSLPKRILAASNGDRPAAGAQQGTPIPDGQRNARLTSIAGAMRRQGANQGAIEAALLAIECETPLPEREIQAIAASVSRYEPEPDTTEDGYHLTDAGNAEYFTDRYSDRLRYDHQRRRWLKWGSHRWREDTDSQVMRLALTATRRRYKEAVSIADLEYREKVAKWTIGSEQRARLEACIAIAKALKPIADAGDSWDGDGFLFCVKNGVIDLRTGDLRDGQPEDMITKQSPVNYDPGARAPSWEAFLGVITGGNTDLATYLQRAVGYSLTGTNKNQVFFFAYGLGNNGKSTFLNTIRRVMGDYSHKLDIDDLMIKDKRAVSGPKEGLADLQGKRFVLAGEIQDGRRLDVGLVKDMTGGETIQARRLYEHGLEYLPSHKLWLMGNHKPVITDTTLSIWRRVKLIPFIVTIPDQAIDIDFPLRLEPELPGILAWAVQGCLDWQRCGLAEPAVVTTSTATYRHDSDILGDFIDDCCVLQPLATVAKSDLKAEYHKWAEDTGVEPVTQRTFKNRLIEKGIIEGRSSDHKTRMWRGIRLRTEQDISDKTDKTNTIL